MPRTATKGSFKPGHSGNPKGYSPEQSMVWHIKTLMNQPSKRKRCSITRLHSMADQLITLAENGNLEALKLVMERIDGKVRDQLDLTLQRGPLLIASPLFTTQEQRVLGPVMDADTYKDVQDQYPNTSVTRSHEVVSAILPSVITGRLVLGDDD